MTAHVLIACEESQAVCMAFRARGLEAYSCDIQEPSGGHPEWHILGDVLQVIEGGQVTTMDGTAHDVGRWDMMIAHPPCTHLASSGARWFVKKRADGRQREAIEFFCKLLTTDIRIVAVENPVGIMSGDYITRWYPDLSAKWGLPYKPVQIIQPYWFGDPERKTTCLYGHGWMPLQPTNMVKPQIVKYKNGRGTDSLWHMDTLKLLPKERAKVRSKTFPGIAAAMADQWGGLLL